MIAIDPVCGMEVDAEKAAASTIYRDETYYFCNARCKERFQAEPEKFLKSVPTIEIGTVQLSMVKVEGV